MKWIAGFLAAGVVTFAGLGLVAGNTFEPVASPAPEVSPVMVKLPVAPAVPAVKPVVVKRNVEGPTEPDVIFLDGDDFQVEEGAFFSRRGPVRAKRIQVPAKPIN